MFYRFFSFLPILFHCFFFRSFPIFVRIHNIYVLGIYIYIYIAAADDTDVVDPVDPKSDDPLSSPSYTSGGGGGDNDHNDNDNAKKDAVCPGLSTARPLGRHAHASAYIESKADDVNALFVFGGRENDDDLTPLGDLW